MRTYQEAQKADNRHEVQWLKPMARIRCDIARCKNRATMLIGRAQTGRSNLWAICDNHAEELVKNLPEHLLPLVSPPKANSKTPSESNTASQTSTNAEGGPEPPDVLDKASETPEYARECCGAIFTSPADYRKHRRYDCREKENA